MVEIHLPVFYLKEIPSISDKIEKLREKIRLQRLNTLKGRVLSPPLLDYYPFKKHVESEMFFFFQFAVQA